METEQAFSPVDLTEQALLLSGTSSQSAPEKKLKPTFFNAVAMGILDLKEASITPEKVQKKAEKFRGKSKEHFEKYEETVKSLEQQLLSSPEYRANYEAWAKRFVDESKNSENVISTEIEEDASEDDALFFRVSKTPLAERATHRQILDYVLELDPKDELRQALATEIYNKWAKNEEVQNTEYFSLNKKYNALSSESAKTAVFEKIKVAAGRPSAIRTFLYAEEGEQKPAPIAYSKAYKAFKKKNPGLRNLTPKQLFAQLQLDKNTNHRDALFQEIRQYLLLNPETQLNANLVDGADFEIELHHLESFMTNTDHQEKVHYKFVADKILDDLINKIRTLEKENTDERNNWINFFAPEIIAAITKNRDIVINANADITEKQLARKFLMAMRILEEKDITDQNYVDNWLINEMPQNQDNLTINDIANYLARLKIEGSLSPMCLFAHKNIKHNVPIRLWKRSDEDYLAPLNEEQNNNGSKQSDTHLLVTDNGLVELTHPLGSYAAYCQKYAKALTPEEDWIRTKLGENYEDYRAALADPEFAGRPEIDGVILCRKCEINIHLTVLSDNQEIKEHFLITPAGMLRNPSNAILASLDPENTLSIHSQFDKKKGEVVYSPILSSGDLFASFGNENGDKDLNYWIEIERDPARPISRTDKFQLKSKTYSLQPYANSDDWCLYTERNGLKFHLPIKEIQESEKTLKDKDGKEITIKTYKLLINQNNEDLRIGEIKFFPKPQKQEGKEQEMKSVGEIKVLESEELSESTRLIPESSDGKKKKKKKKIVLPLDARPQPSPQIGAILPQGFSTKPGLENPPAAARNAATLNLKESSTTTSTAENSETETSSKAPSKVLHEMEAVSQLIPKNKGEKYGADSDPAQNDNNTGASAPQNVTNPETPNGFYAAIADSLNNIETGTVTKNDEPNFSEKTLRDLVEEHLVDPTHTEDIKLRLYYENKHTHREYSQNVRFTEQDVKDRKEKGLPAKYIPGNIETDGKFILDELEKIDGKPKKFLVVETKTQILNETEEYTVDGIDSETREKIKITRTRNKTAEIPTGIYLFDKDGRREITPEELGQLDDRHVIGLYHNQETKQFGSIHSLLPRSKKFNFLNGVVKGGLVLNLVIAFLPQMLSAGVEAQDYFGIGNRVPESGIMGIDAFIGKFFLILYFSVVRFGGPSAWDRLSIFIYRMFTKQGWVDLKNALAKAIQGNNPGITAEGCLKLLGALFVGACFGGLNILACLEFNRLVQKGKDFYPSFLLKLGEFFANPAVYWACFSASALGNLLSFSGIMEYILFSWKTFAADIKKTFTDGTPFEKARMIASLIACGLVVGAVIGGGFFNFFGIYQLLVRLEFGATSSLVVGSILGVGMLIFMLGMGAANSIPVVRNFVEGLINSFRTLHVWRTMGLSEKEIEELEADLKTKSDEEILAQLKTLFSNKFGIGAEKFSDELNGKLEQLRTEFSNIPTKLQQEYQAKRAEKLSRGEPEIEVNATLKSPTQEYIDAAQEALLRKFFAEVLEEEYRKHPGLREWFKDTTIGQKVETVIIFGLKLVLVGPGGLPAAFQSSVQGQSVFLAWMAAIASAFTEWNGTDAMLRAASNILKGITQNIASRVEPACQKAMNIFGGLEAPWSKTESTFFSGKAAHAHEYGTNYPTHSFWAHRKNPENGKYEINVDNLRTVEVNTGIRDEHKPVYSF